jgi:hypothetical protein
MTQALAISPSGQEYLPWVMTSSSADDDGYGWRADAHGMDFATAVLDPVGNDIWGLHVTMANECAPHEICNDYDDQIVRLHY